MEATNYCAPSGMSSSDFQSMLRKRNLHDLINRLIAQGRVQFPGQQSNGVPANAAQQTDVVDEVAANVVETKTIGLRALKKRGLQNRQSRSDNDSRSSNSNSASSPTKTVSKSATSTSIHEELAEVVPEIPPRNPARALYALVKRGLRAPSMESNSSLHSHEANSQPAEPGDQEEQQPEIDFRGALAGLQQQYEKAEPQSGYPMIEQIVQVGRIRRKIAKLDFDEDEKILMASDFMSCAPTLPPRKPLPGERPERAKQLAMLDVIRVFTSRLASRVHRRIAFLELQGRMGSVIQIEHWYREVNDVVGWRDDEEMQMHWSWRENDGFFGDPLGSSGV